jgi:hypothetical protein
MTAKNLDAQSDMFPFEISSRHLRLVSNSDARSSEPLSQNIKSMSLERLAKSRSNLLATMWWCGGRKVDPDV